MYEFVLEEKKLITDPYIKKRTKEEGFEQFLYRFVYDGIKGIFEDTGYNGLNRYHLAWDGLHANYDEITGTENYSDFSENDPAHIKLLEELYKVSGIRVLSAEYFMEKKREPYKKIFGDLDIDFTMPVKGEVIMQHIDIIVACLTKAGYKPWIKEKILLNPDNLYTLWIRGELFGFYKTRER